jgi:hypothetical protein
MGYKRQRCGSSDVTVNRWNVNIFVLLSSLKVRIEMCMDQEAYWGFSHYVSLLVMNYLYTGDKYATHKAIVA